VSARISWKRLTGLVVPILFVSACTSEEIVLVSITSVEVVPANVNAVQGDRLQLTATVHDARNGELTSVVVEWRSDDPSIASVDANGVLTAHAPGTVLVHATFQGVSGSATVVVLPGPSIAVSRDSVTIFSGVGGTPSPEVVSVTNGGTGTLGEISVSAAYPSGTPRQWLTASPLRTTVPASLTLQASTQGLGAGTYAAGARLTAAGSASERLVTVVLQVTGFLVTQSGGSSSVTEAGGTDTIFVVLTARPSSNVVFDVRSSDPTEVVPNRSFLTFTPSNWNVAQSVTLIGVDDVEDDGNQTSTITVAVNDGLSDDVFEGLPDQTVSVTTIDNDDPAPRFTITESGGSTRVTEAGASDSISVVLGSPPTSNVVLDITSADPGEVTVARSPLTFTPANWSVAQSVPLTGVDDALYDGDQTSLVRVSVNDAASDDRYDPLPDQTVSVVTVDNDGAPPPAGITVTESGGGTRVTEAGGSDSITVVLASPPTSNVILAISSGDVGEVVVVTSLITFTPGNWNVTQAVVVRGVDDVTDDGDQAVPVTISVSDAASDDRYDPVADRTVTVTNVDDDDPLPPAGISVSESGGGTRVTEAGGTDDVFVLLTSRPTFNVVLDVTSADEGEVTASPASLTFTPANWNVPQTIVVTGVDDSDDDGNQTTTVRIAVNDGASDDRYDPVADRTVTVTTVDDDDPPPPAGITVTESGGATSVTEAGSSDDITVVLTSPPAANVVLDVTSSDTGEATVSPATLTFTPANWSTAQTVVATGVDDSDDDGNQTTTVRIAVNDGASDDRYDALADRTVTVTTVDDDDPPPAGVTVTESGGTTRVTEAGGTDTISVVLASPPTSNVVLDVTSENTAEAAVSPASLTFTPANWNVTQRIVVTGVDDAADDGDQAVTVRIAVNDGASDDGYDPLADQTVTVTNADDDPLPVSIIIADGPHAEERWRWPCGAADEGPSLAMWSQDQQAEDLGWAARVRFPAPVSVDVFDAVQAGRGAHGAACLQHAWGRRPGETAAA
jgi:hypothetical protein